MRHSAVFVWPVVNLFLISHVSGLSLKKVSSTFLSKRLGDSNRDNCINIKCSKDERVCAKMRTKVEFSTAVTVINKCELEYIKCNEGMEAIELPMKYCRDKKALENARKFPSNRRSKRSPAIATKTPNTNLGPKVSRKRLANKPKINYSSLYFGPRSRKDADAETSAEGEPKKKTANRDQTIEDDALTPEKRERISLAMPSDHINHAQTSKGDQDVGEESPKRNQEVKPAEETENTKTVAFTIQTNNANRGAQLDAETSKESNKDQEVDAEDEAANDGTAKADRDVEIGNDDGKPSKESPNRDQEVDPESGAEDDKRQKIHLIIQNNNDEDDDGSKKARDANVETLNDKKDDDLAEADVGGKNGVVVMIDPSNSNRQVEDNGDDANDADSGKARDANVETLNDKTDDDLAEAEVGGKNGVVVMIDPSNSNRQVEDNGDDANDADSGKARDATVETLNDKGNLDTADAEADDADGNRVVLMIASGNDNRQVDNDDEDADGPEKTRDVTVETLNDKVDGGSAEADAGDDGKKGVVVMIDPDIVNRQVDVDDDDDDGEQGNNGRDLEIGGEEDEDHNVTYLDGENEVEGEKENREELKDDMEENDNNAKNTEVVIESPAGTAVDVIIDKGTAGETLGGADGDPDDNNPTKLDGEVPEGADSTSDEIPDGPKSKQNSVEQDRSSLEGAKKTPDYEDVNVDEYKSDCPSVCPARDVMVCARCKEGVYRTFMSICHLRMFNCKHPEEKLELVGRSPCMMSAPFLNDMPKAQGRVGEPGDEDTIVEYLRCKGKAALKDPKCKGHAAKEEAKKRRYRL